jgi:hypothetical protein
MRRKTALVGGALLGLLAALRLRKKPALAEVEPAPPSEPEAEAPSVDDERRRVHESGRAAAEKMRRAGETEAD